MPGSWNGLGKCQPLVGDHRFTYLMCLGGFCKLFRVHLLDLSSDFTHPFPIAWLPRLAGPDGTQVAHRKLVPNSAGKSSNSSWMLVSAYMNSQPPGKCQPLVGDARVGECPITLLHHTAFCTSQVSKVKKR